MTGDPFSKRAVQAAYEAVAEDYEAAFAADLDELALDQAVIDRAAARLAGAGAVLDVGCGPGQVAARIRAGGAQVIGVDLSPAMLTLAQRRLPGLPVIGADMRSLPLATGSCAGIVAFYSVQHVGRAGLATVLGEFHRVLVDGGIFIVATHLGEGDFTTTEFLGHEVDLVGGSFFSMNELLDALVAAAFVIDVVEQRGPLAHEHPSIRAYVTAHCG